MTVMIIVALGILGVIFGSFINALVWRLHEQAELEGQKTKKANKRRQELSISKGRSMCPHCEHTLAAKDLVPVLSWVWLRGKCRYCKAPIGWQYPLVELFTGALFAWSYAAWPLSLHGVGLFQFVCWLVFLVGFVSLAVYDLKWYLLPDRVVAPLSALAALQTVVVALWAHSWSLLYEPLLAAAIIFGLFWLLFQVSRGAWIGGGDVKLAICLGLLAATPLKSFMVIFFASLIGTVVSIPLLLRGKQGLRLQIPFGPYLLAATVIVVLYGGTIVDWYQRLLLP
jgi:prepilin signal peptidase PulO-like enzyme (type II secretory pathway)